MEVLPAAPRPGNNHRDGVKFCQSTSRFSCKTANKMISVCASRDIGSTSGSMQYRFGMLGKIELQYPSEKADSRSHFSEGAEVYAESIISHLAFSTGNYKYVIYDMMFTNFPDPKRNDLDKFPTHNSYDGVLVYKSNGLDESLIKVIQCRHKAVSAPLPEGSLRRDEKVFEFSDDIFQTLSPSDKLFP